MKDKFFANTLTSWYSEAKRDLPWRDTTDPYKIWLSEIILQQTKVEQGLPYYLRFIEKFPNVQSLAQADIDIILKLWEGLGYYSRAKNLHRCAQTVVKEYSSIFPDSYNKLLKLPGVGPYSAAAIASFAYKEPVAVLDGNVYRVLSRVFGIKDDIATGRSAKVFTKLANELIDRDRPDLFNQAIMEYGALQCKPKQPKCNTCELTNSCYAFEHNAQDRLPVKSKKTKITTRYFHYIIFSKDDKLAMKKRDDSGIWKGLFEFQLLESEKHEESEDVLKRILGNFSIQEISKQYKHILSHQRIYATFYALDIAADLLDDEYSDLKFYSLDEVEQLAKPVLISKYLNDYIF